jgi:hypothetical protein
VLARLSVITRQRVHHYNILRRRTIHSFTIERVVREVNKELLPAFEEKLRHHLEQQDKEWLIEQIIRMTLDKHNLQAVDRKIYQKFKSEQRAQRLERLRKMALDEPRLDAFVTKYDGYTREQLEAEGYLIDAPAKGTELVPPECRTEKGERLLTEAKDILFAVLFGDASTYVTFDRVEQELLTMTLPLFKAAALDFMKATTEIGGLGTWQDPHGVSNDDRAETVLLQIEYGEIANERMGDYILTTLSLINNLEVNEQILYVRIINVEQSSLIT